jgi:hypothetical protein
MNARKSHMKNFFFSTKEKSEKKKLVKQFGLLCALEEKPRFNFVKKTYLSKQNLADFPYENTAALYTTTPQKHVSDLTPTFYNVIVVTAI